MRTMTHRGKEPWRCTQRTLRRIQWLHMPRRAASRRSAAALIKLQLRD